MFSGGLDSTYLAWSLLKEGYQVVLYHVVLKNKLNRWEEEHKAMLSILSEFKKEFDLKYVEVTLDVSDLEMTYDSDYYIPLGATYCKTYNVKEMHIGFISEDRDVMQKDYYERVELLSAHKAKLILPLLQTTKKEIYEKLPEKYKRLTFSCRSPMNGRPCERCVPCKAISKIKEELK